VGHVMFLEGVIAAMWITSTLSLGQRGVVSAAGQKNTYPRVTEKIHVFSRSRYKR